MADRAGDESGRPHQDHDGALHVTSRAQLDRLLDPANTSVTLHTLGKTASMVGRRLRLELV